MFRLSELYKSLICTCSLTIILLLTQSAFPQSSPLTIDGGADTYVYKTDSTIFDSTALDDAGPTLTSGTLSAGVTMMHSPFISILNIPVKYGLNDNFQISLSVPFLTKTLSGTDTHHIRNGFGDTTLGITAFFEPAGFLSSSTTARVTLPTGDADAMESGVYVPMGCGSYTASIQQGVSAGRFNTGIFNIRFFADGVAIYYPVTTQRVDAATKNSYDKTYAWAATGGIDIGLAENLNVEIKGNYISLKERKYKAETYPVAPGDWARANDSLKQINLIPVIKYRFPHDVSGLAGIIYPLKTTHNDTAEKIYDPRIKLIMGIEKRFGDTANSNRLNKKSFD